VAQLGRAQQPQRRGQPERQQLERDRRHDPVDDLVRRRDHDEPLGRRRDDLLARMRAAAALDQPALGVDLVGAVDRDVEPLELLERLDLDPQRARRDLGRDGGRHAADVQLPRRERRQHRRDRRAGAEPDLVAVAHQLRRRLGRRALLGIAISHRRRSGRRR
jgi:hypothetical protein